MKFRFFLRWLQYYRRATTLYASHTPFISDFIVHVMDGNKMYYAFTKIESYRKTLLQNKKSILFEDHGAGSRLEQSDKRKICDIARQSATSTKDGEILFNSVLHFQPKKILELGTSLGIGTAYLASAKCNATVYTIEGNPSSARIARQGLEKLGIHNVEPYEGTFYKKLEEVLNKARNIDLVFLDGHHDGTATIQYFNMILPYLSENAVIILDDIYWSEDMAYAFNTLKNHHSINLSIDIYSKGFLFLDPSITPYKDVSLIDSRLKPWQKLFYKNNH